MDILVSQRLEFKDSMHHQYEEWTYLINQSFKMIMYYFPEGKSTKWEAKALFSYMLPNGRDSHNCDKVSNVLSWILRHFRIFLMSTSWNKTKQNKKGTECDTSRLNKYISSGKSLLNWSLFLTRWESISDVQMHQEVMSKNWLFCH